ncbi:MAG: DUF1175 family protein [Bryobacteraceae bacterium]
MKWPAIVIGLLALGAAVSTASRVYAPAPPTAPKARPATFALSDSFDDGTPDFLRLTAPADRAAFRGWFSFLAESLFERETRDLPADVADCAAFVRFAYREALRRHDGAWGASIGLMHPPALGAIAKYDYPHTPLAARLFRTRQGRFDPASMERDFAEFADAETLMRRNSFFLSRSLDEGKKGDLLFFHQPGQKFPYHVMILLDGAVVYHTGPTGDDPGEVRRPTFAELRAHPNPQWRPLPGNEHFLGVFRWNILKDSF